jgi:hypothetical protein
LALSDLDGAFRKSRNYDPMKRSLFLPALCLTLLSILGSSAAHSQGPASPSAPPRTTLATFVSIAPNPFSTTSTITFHLKQGGPTKLKLFDAAGHELRTLLEATLDSGKHTVIVKREMLPQSGIYFCELVLGSEQPVSDRISFVK